MTFLATIWAVAVFCTPLAPGTAGTYEPNGAILLATSTCASIERPASLDWRAEAVFVLAHEEGHAHDARLGFPVDVAYLNACGRPGTCEAFADCYGASKMVAVARELGFSGYQARRFRANVHGRRWTLGYSAIPQRCFT